MRTNAEGYVEESAAIVKKALDIEELVDKRELELSVLSRQVKFARQKAVAAANELDQAKRLHEKVIHEFFLFIVFMFIVFIAFLFLKVQN